MITINVSTAADNNIENDEDLQRALAISMDNQKTIDIGQPKKVDDPTVEPQVKRPTYLPLPEEPKCDRSLLCKVGVRLPDGRRIQRNFLRTDPVQVDVLLSLFWSLAFVYCTKYYSIPQRLLSAI